MALKEQLDQDLKESMRAGDSLKTDTLRGLKASITEFEKSGNGPLTPDVEITLVNRSVKKRKESIEIYEKHNRQDLADKEKKELNILIAYLPTQMNEEEIRSYIEGYLIAVKVTAKSEMNKVIGPIMKDLKGKADGKMIRTILDSILV